MIAEVGEGSRLVELDAVDRMVFHAARRGHRFSTGRAEAEAVRSPVLRELKILAGLKKVVLLELVREQEGRLSLPVDVDELQEAVTRRRNGEHRVVSGGIGRAVGD